MSVNYMPLVATASTPLQYLQCGVRDSTTNSANSKQEQPQKQRRLAYHYTEGSNPIVLFLPGYRSTMTGTKALTLENHCRRTGRAFCRFDYQGHGATAAAALTESTTTENNNNTTTDSLFMKLTLGDWIEDTLAMVDHLLCPSKQHQQQLRRIQGKENGSTSDSSSCSRGVNTNPSILLVGSSMGVWIAVHVALQRSSEMIAGIVGLAAAIDFTYDLRTSLMSKKEHADELTEKGVVWRSSMYDDGRPYPFTKLFLDESERWMLLRKDKDEEDDKSDVNDNEKLIAVQCPVRLLHGQLDEDVSYMKSIQLSQRLVKASVTLLPKGDHRLSTPADLQKMIDTVEDLLAQVER